MTCNLYTILVLFYEAKKPRQKLIVLLLMSLMSFELPVFGDTDFPPTKIAWDFSVSSEIEYAVSPKLRRTHSV